MFLYKRIPDVFIIHSPIVLLQLKNAKATKIVGRDIPYAKKESALVRPSYYWAINHVNLVSVMFYATDSLEHMVNNIHLMYGLEGNS